MTILDRVTELGLELPKATTPGGSYKSLNVRGSIAFLAIQFPIFNKQFLHQGSLGNEINTANGYKAAQLCGLNVLAQIHEKIGFENIEGLNHFDAYYVASPEWDEAPKAIDGASDLFLNILGEKGEHSRAIFGVHNLPRNFCIGLTANFTLKK